MRPTVRPRCFANKTSIKTQQQRTPSLLSPTQWLLSARPRYQEDDSPNHLMLLHAVCFLRVWQRRPPSRAAPSCRVHLPLGAATGQGQPRPVLLLAAASVPTKTCVDEVHVYSLGDDGQKVTSYLNCVLLLRTSLLHLHLNTSCALEQQQWQMI